MILLNLSTGHTAVKVRTEKARFDISSPLAGIHVRRVASARAISIDEKSICLRGASGSLPVIIDLFGRELGKISP